MQIQRLQTLYLFIALIFTVAFCFTPFATFSDTYGETFRAFVSESIILLILSITLAALILIDIFLYRNLKLQINTLKIIMALTAGTIVTTVIYVIVGNGDIVSVAKGGTILLVLAELFSVLAFKRIKYDRNLLASVERLR